LIVFSLLLAASLALVLLLKNNQPMPTTIKTQLESPALLPSSGSEVTIDKTSYKYDAANKVFSYDIKSNNGGVSVVTEQPTPSEFLDIPTTFDKVVNSLGPSLTFDSPVGVVSVGHPASLPTDSEVGIARSEGTLIFVRTYTIWTESQWRKFFNNLDAVRLNR
jgi:hypothetical protein